MRSGGRGLRDHLTLVTAVAVAGALTLGSLAVFLFTRQQLFAQMDATLDALAREAEPQERPFAGEYQIVFDTGRLSGERGIAQFVAVEGGILRPFPRLSELDALELGPFDLLDPDPFVAIDDRARAVAAGEEEAYYENVEVRGLPMRMLTRQVFPGLAIQVAQPLDELNTVLSRVAVVLLALIVVGAAVAAMLGRAIATSAVRRVGQMTSVAEEVTATRNFGRRLEVTGNDELSRLGSTFNAMLDALESSIASQKQLVADASHELRTPLTSVRTNIEVLSRSELPADERREILTAVTAQLEELSHLVTSIVELARDGESREDEQDIPVEEVVAEAVERARRLTRHGAFDLQVEAWTACGDPRRLTRAVTNLLDNAIKYNVNGEAIEVRVRPGEISVRDHGPGIGESDLPHVFDRFYRAPAARGTPGSGLGLAIVKDVAESFGGTVSAENAPDWGAIVTLRMSAHPEG
ncbi:MAG TPA: HAMP domain-containing sensor histidine kinase [Actinomycetota bacterium]|nr:HAMP domain-containing sensor histidine kinase [Actinomycetota bacterium]